MLSEIAVLKHLSWNGAETCAMHIRGDRVLNLSVAYHVILLNKLLHCTLLLILNRTVMIFLIITVTFHLFYFFFYILSMATHM